MKWYNLKKNKCPNCGANLDTTLYDGNRIRCNRYTTCGFNINQDRLAEIVASQSLKHGNQYHSTDREGWGRFNE